MTYITRVAMLAAILLFALPGQAQEVRIAIVDFQRAVVESSEGSKARERFDATVEEHRTRIEQKQNEIVTAQNELQAQERLLSEQARSDRMRELDRRRIDLDRDVQDTERELNMLQQELLVPLTNLAQQILVAMASERRYDIVIDISLPNTSVLWVNPNNDITPEFIRNIDAATAAAAAAATPATPD